MPSTDETFERLKVQGQQIITELRFLYQEKKQGTKRPAFIASRMPKLIGRYLEIAKERLNLFLH